MFRVTRVIGSNCLTRMGTAHSHGKGPCGPVGPSTIPPRFSFRVLASAFVVIGEVASLSYFQLISSNAFGDLTSFK